MVKGHTENFNPMSPTFNIHPVDRKEDDIKGIVVNVKDLKAIFVVKFFEGHPPQDPNAEHTLVASPNGMAMKVTFKDGEELTGTTMTYDPNGMGFFIFPTDPNSNNERVFVVNEAVRNVEHVNLAKTG